MIKIAGIEFDDEQVTNFDYLGTTEKKSQSESIDGTNREKVTTLITREYNLVISGLDKRKVDELAAELQKLSLDYEDIEVDVLGIIAGELIGYTLQTIPDTVDLDFNIENIELRNINGHYVVTIPVFHHVRP
jgi:hypothetical protein